MPYFFFVFGAVLGVFVEDLEAVVLEEGVVFFAEAGLEVLCFLEAEGLASFAAVFLVAAVLITAFFTAFGRGSVFKETEAGTSSTGAAGRFLAASREFGKKSSMR